MSQRPTLDPSSFETLLFAAWVLQCQRDQDARNRRPVPAKTLAKSSDTQVDAVWVTKRDTTGARLMPALSTLNDAAEVGANQNAARQMVGTLPSVVRTEEAVAPEGKEISRSKIQESFRSAGQSSLSWPAVREQWELGTASVGHCAWRASQAFQRAHTWLSSTAISAARCRPSLQTEFAGRYLSAQSSLLSSPRRAGQELRTAATHGPLPRHSTEALGQGLQYVMPSFLNATASARNRLESFARYRVKVRVTLSPRRVAEAAGASLSVLLIVIALTLFQGWHHEDFHVVAATTGMNRQSGESTARKADQFRPILPLQVSHRQVTDRAVLSVVQGLSRYEIHALRRQAYYGDDSAALIMGMLYETGRYVPQSCSKAADWVARSANWGNAAAQYNLGLRYRDGDGLPANQDDAKKWLQKAAEHRYSNAGLALEALTSLGAHSTYVP